MRGSLNAAADSVNEIANLTVSICGAREQAIRDRQGTTYEQDIGDLGVIRAECNEYYDALERIRQAHNAILGEE